MNINKKNSFLFTIQNKIGEYMYCPAGIDNHSCLYYKAPPGGYKCDNCEHIKDTVNIISNIPEIKKGIELYEHYLKGDLVMFLTIEKMRGNNKI